MTETQGGQGRRGSQMAPAYGPGCLQERLHDGGVVADPDPARVGGARMDEHA